MPSLRKRVSSYFRQLSFHNETREKRSNFNENTFVTKYLQGHISLRDGPPIIYGKNPTDLPNYELGKYENGPDSVIGCYSGPNGGLTTVRRTEKHLSLLDADIDFIDTQDEEIVQAQTQKKSPQRVDGRPIDNTTMVIKVAGHEYCVTNKPKRHSKSQSLSSISDFNIEIEKTKIEKSFYSSCDENVDDRHQICDNDTKNNEASVNVGNLETNGNQKVDRSLEIKKPVRNLNQANSDTKNSRQARNYNLSKSKSDGNTFHHKKKGRIIKIERPNLRGEEATENQPDTEIVIDDSLLPNEWNRKSDFFYGLSDSLYDRNQVTRNRNGDPIADCFGLIARNDSAILAVADGVNWGEKASIAAKSAVHGCLHYLNKTIFNDTKPFENLTLKTDEASISSNLNPTETNLISNTREVFVCLLRAFNCAHDLILENKGMLTTLTAAVVLPLKQKLEKRDGFETQYVCCVCNVGDTLAYVYSQKFGVRELTKGSHDVTSNRDMRDALGALGPVDGTNPELSNLTLSITTLQKGDIVMVASDGLTDNFDPNVCRFTVNSDADLSKPKKNPVNKPARNPNEAEKQKPPQKPPRKSKNPDGTSRSSAECSSAERSSIERSSIKSGTVSTNSSNENDGSNAKKEETDYDNPLVAHFMKQNSLDESRAARKSSLERKKPVVVENKASSLRRQASSQNRQENTNKNPQKSAHTISTAHPQAGYKFLKSKTSLDLRPPNHPRQIQRNEDGIPYVTPIQRYELQMLLMEDVLKNGISGNDSPCAISRKLCENLVSFTTSITAAKRRTLEDPDFYFDNRNGVMVEVSGQEKKVRRKRGLEKVQNLPGKLDHVSVVAYNVGNFRH